MELKSWLASILGRLFSWKRMIIAGVLLVGVLLTIFLAGTVPPQNIHVVNGKNYLAQVYSEVPNPSIGYSESLNTWSLASAKSSDVQLNTVGVTTLSGTFVPSSTPTSVQISRSLSVNITGYPIMFLEVSVTKGVSYGLRFYSSSPDNRTLIPLSNDSDFLNHRLGTGNAESIQVNMQLLSQANTGIAAENITKLQLYVERGPAKTSLPFSAQILNLEFLSFQIGQFVPNQTYHSVYFTFDSFPGVNSSLWQLNKIDLDLDVQATPGTSYVFYQLNGTTATVGSTYKYSSTISSYEYSLYPKGGQRVFSDAVPPGGNYSIVIVALSGALTHVSLRNVSFVYTPTMSTPQTAPSAASGAFWYTYLIFMLFVLPIGIAIILYLRTEELKPFHLIAALGAGILCRFALAPVAMQPFDIGVYATSARGWFEYGASGVSLGPTLPFTFLLYWVPYSFYAVLLKMGFHDFYILNHQTGFVESFFLKGFPIAADCFAAYLIFKFSPNDNRGKVLSIFYFLNPLSIYISSVWGQYEAATAAFIVLGFFFMSRAGEDDGNSPLHSLAASLAFIVSALVELVGLIPFVFLSLKSILTRPFKIFDLLLVLCPILLLFAFPPEWHMIYLIAAAAVGASSTLLLAQPHTPYTIFSNFPQLAAFHPLIIMLALVLGVFLWKRQFDLRGMVSITLTALVVFLLFSAQQPQWWIMVIPVSLVYAIISENYGIGPYVLAFGAMVAFLILSFTQGSGYLLFGSPHYNLLPGIENAKHGIDVYTLTTTLGGIAILGYLLAGSYLSGTRPLIRGSLYLVAAFLASFLCFSVAGLAL